MGPSRSGSTATSCASRDEGSAVSTDGTPQADDVPAGIGPSPEELRPLPDGGLGTAMPDWLRRPPAWRDLKPREVTATHDLPAPDTSVIDPRAFVDLADLPPWLQAIAARGDTLAASAGVGGQPATEGSSAPEVAEEPRQQPATSGEKVPEALDFSTPAPSVPWWQSGIVLMTLAVLLTVAVILIVLLATDVL